MLRELPDRAQRFVIPDAVASHRDRAGCASNGLQQGGFARAVFADKKVTSEVNSISFKDLTTFKLKGNSPLSCFGHFLAAIDLRWSISAMAQPSQLDRAVEVV